MKKTKKTRLFNFLIELLLVIVIFAMSSMIVVKLFYYGRDVVLEDKHSNEAMLIASNIAEKMRVYDGEDLDSYLNYDNDQYVLDIKVDKKCNHYCLYTSEIKVSDEIVEINFKVESVGENHE